MVVDWDIIAFVVVEFCAIKSWMFAKVENNSEIVALFVVKLVTVVVAKLEVDVATSVPVTRLEVVAKFEVKLLKIPVILLKSEIKELVLVLLVATRFVVEASVE